VSSSQAVSWVSGVKSASRSTFAVGLSLLAFVLLGAALIVGDETERVVASAVAATIAAAIMIMIADSVSTRDSTERSLWLGFGGATILRATSASIAAIDMTSNPAAFAISELTLGINIGAALVLATALLIRQARSGISWPLTLLDVILVSSVVITAFALILDELGRASTAVATHVALALGLSAADIMALTLLVVIAIPLTAKSATARWLLAGWTLVLVADFEGGLSFVARDIDVSAVYLMSALSAFTLGVAGVFHLTDRSDSLETNVQQERNEALPEAGNFALAAVAVGCLACVAVLASEAMFGQDQGEWRLVLSFAAFGAVAGFARLAVSARQQRLKALNLRERQVELEQQAMTDSMTELPNHRALLSRLSEEVERAKRFKQPLSLCFIDVDAFKQINDSLGHQMGDEVLREIGSILRANARQIDIVARYGGEEFVILLPGTWTDDAFLFAERLREAIAITVIRPHENVDIRLSVSIGVAGLPEHASDRESLLKLADDAVYVAKRSGRNQVHLFDPNLPLGSGAAFSVEVATRLVQVVELRQTMSVGHSDQVARLSSEMATRLGLDANEVDRIRLAALLHDVGKISVPDSILAKNGPLSVRETEIMRGHAAIGARLLEGNAALVPLASAVRHHHERWDGTGYPYRLAGENIPLAARIVALAEAYSAMTNDAPWRSALTDREAIVELMAMAGRQFDPKLVELFVGMAERSSVIEVG
jgi:diguanylate cyclase (GGDEF)-like protein/putative nucleotidyltransferase with HDIG domain